MKELNELIGNLQIEANYARTVGTVQDLNAKKVLVKDSTMMKYVERFKEIYKELFSEDEIKELNEIFKKPVMGKYIDTGNKVEEKFQEFFQELNKEIMEDYARITQDHLAKRNKD